MSTPLLMPALSPTMTEGGIVLWHCKEGDALRAGEVLLEIETDKAIAEVEAPFDAVLERILHPAGAAGIVVGAPIALLGGHGGAAAAPAQPAPEPALAASTLPRSMPPTQASQDTGALPARGPRLFVTPLARRIAREQGIDLGSLSGSGPLGRIVKRDVHAAVGLRLQAAARMMALGPVRLTIACRVDAASRWCDELAAQGAAVEIDDVMLAACTRALRHVPQANSTWTDEGAVVHDEVRIALQMNGAPATVVLPDVGQQGLQQLAQERLALLAAARDGRLEPSRCPSPTFSLVRLDCAGLRELAVPPAPPLACVLAFGPAEERAVASEGAVVVARVMTCTLSADPRAVDAVLAADFLAELGRLVENPLRMVL